MIAQQGDRLLVQGAVTLANVTAELAAGLALLTRDGLIVDLGGVEEADSSALSLLLEWQRAAKARGYTLRFANMPANMQSFAKLYGVEELIPLA
ncbi:MAG TPA: STAS domain-containing protein [Burkholderiales bacterium]|nr:STAS domain-containing protein [Burkholderiales bacterium]